MKIPQVTPEPLGGGALARRALDGGSPWFVPRPAGSEGWRTRAEATRADFARRDWLGPLEPALQLGGAAAQRLQRVVDANGVVVTTGQQPYTLYKALTALALADAIEAATGVPAAPLFWAATDDTDFEEARHAAVALPGGLRTLTLAGAAGADGRALAEMPLGDVSDALDVLLTGAASGAGTDVAAAIRAAHHAGATLGSSYVGLLRTVLQPLGVAVLDAWDESVRQAAGAPLRRALAQAEPLARALRVRSDAIRADGLAPQVHDMERLSLVWSWQDGTRRRFGVAEGPEAARRAPEGSLSATVLLRPVIERQLVPTVAYVAGPGELAYFAQVTAVAETLGWPAPLAVPRWSGTLIEPHVQRLLERLAIDRSLLKDTGAVETAVARRAVPPGVRGVLDGLRQDIVVRMAALREGAASVLPGPAIEGAERQIAHKLERLERRLVAATKRVESQLMRDVATVLGALHPNGGRQERTLSWAPLVARHGEPLVVALRAAAAEHANALVDAAVPASR
ncbi:MAG: bacillithiol biosynthesis cysteine-adding enzyme BshC [Gemmatimonadaceae bacterium]|nr:bacillithiol biosynthesis cysteine-adding enzyme BshC [Gemmatimonadaceae bacterium]